MATIAPSILSADFGRLAEQVAAVAAGGAGLIHVDVMDGHFVPNLTLGPAVCAAVRKATHLPVDVHLMVEEPDRFIDAFRAAGADWISVHYEACVHLQRTVAQIRKIGASPGVVLNPATPVSMLEEILADIDFVLVMSVNPGFGGQTFLPRSVDKLRSLRAMIARRGLDVRVEVDGGVGLGNVRQLVEAGADVLVAGSAVFGGDDPKAATRRLVATANGDQT